MNNMELILKEAFEKIEGADLVSIEAARLEY
jgi:hypothetical protein